MKLLELRGVDAYYGELQATSGVELSVDRGEIVCILGANGAGKTTTLKAVMGLVTVGRGDVFVGEECTTRFGPPKLVRLGVALAPEGRRLFAGMSVLENLLVGAHVVRNRTVIKAALERVFSTFPRVYERRHQLAGSLSGGEQQMVAIGRALMANPRLMMLDEPSLGVAPRIVDDIANTILQLRDEVRMSVLLVEQNASVALAISDRGYVLEKGRVVISGPVGELLGNDAVRQSYLGLS